MKKLAILVAVAALLVAVVPAFAVKPNGPSAVNGLANPGTNHLYLYEKDADWVVVAGGAWGKLNYDADSFVFNGHGLEPKTDYTLIRYKDPWPGSPVCLASGTSNKGGNVHLSGDMQEGGPKVWLVSSADVDCDNAAMTGWNPVEYLFEYAEI